MRLFFVGMGCFVLLTVAAQGQVPNIRYESVKTSDLVTSLIAANLHPRKIPKGCQLLPSGRGIHFSMYVNTYNHKNKSTGKVELKLKGPFKIEINDRLETETLVANASGMNNRYYLKIVTVKDVVTLVEAVHWEKRTRNVGTTLVPIIKEYWEKVATATCQ